MLSNSASCREGVRGAAYPRPFATDGVVFHCLFFVGDEIVACDADENREGRRRRLDDPRAARSFCRYSSGMNSSKRIRVAAERGSNEDDWVELESDVDNGDESVAGEREWGNDLNSTNAQLHSRSRRLQSPSLVVAPETGLNDSLAALSSSTSNQPLPHTRSQNTSTNPSSTTSSPPRIGSVSQSKAGIFLLLCCWAFRSFFVSSASRTDQEDIELTIGVLNCSVVERGSSARENPADEKSVHDSVARFSDRDMRALSVKSN